MKIKVLLFVSAISLLALVYFVGASRNTAAVIAKLATQNEQMRLSDERTMRSRTDFARPGVTQEEVDIILEVADHYGMSPALLYAARRTENGGRMLYMGANVIPPSIKKRWDPLAWQYVMFARVWTIHLNKLASKDLMIRNRAMTSLSRQWNVNPEKWIRDLDAHLAESLGSKGLEVTEPPKKSPTSKPTPVKRRTSSKAKGSGHKAPEYSSTR